MGTVQRAWQLHKQEIVEAIQKVVSEVDQRFIKCGRIEQYSKMQKIRETYQRIKGGFDLFTRNTFKGKGGKNI